MRTRVPGPWPRSGGAWSGGGRNTRQLGGLGPLFTPERVRHGRHLVKRIGWRTSGLVGAVACALAGGSGLAVAATGNQRARAFARAEVAYYASRLPTGLRANAGVPGSSVDTECFSAADNRINPGAPVGGMPNNPAW